MQYRFQSFTLHALEGHIADIFIAEYKNSLLLLDCGCKSDHKLIADYITEILHKPIEQLKLLVVTHLHPDHSGSATSLSRKYQIPIAAPEDINLWYKGIRGTAQHLVDMLLAHISARSRKMKLLSVYYPAHIKVDYPLISSSKLPFFPDWEVFNVPGHTEHDIVLYNKKESFLYCSDTIVKIRNKFLSPFPVTDKNKMSESLTLIGGLKVKVIAMAHGGIYEVQNFAELTSNLKNDLAKPLTGILKLFYPLTVFPEPLHKIKKASKYR